MNKLLLIVLILMAAYATSDQGRAKIDRVTNEWEYNIAVIRNFSIERLIP